VSGTGTDSIKLWWEPPGFSAASTHAIDLGTIAGDTDWHDVVVRCDHAIPSGVIDEWFREVTNRFLLHFGTNSGVVLDTQIISLGELGSTLTPLNQLDDLAKCNTEEMSNRLNQSLGYGKYTSFNLETDDALLGRNVIDLSLKDYSAVTPGTNQLVEVYSFDSIILSPSTEYVFTARHSMLEHDYRRRSVRCVIEVIYESTISGTLYLATDGTWVAGASPLNKLHWLSLVDPVTWNQSHLKFTSNTLIAGDNARYKIKIYFQDIVIPATVVSNALGLALFTINTTTDRLLYPFGNGNCDLVTEDSDVLAATPSRLFDVVDFIVTPGGINAQVKVDPYMKTVGTQAPSTTEWAASQAIKIISYPKINAVSLRQLTVAFSANAIEDTKRLPTARYMQSSSSVEDEFRKLYKETGIITYADALGEISARLITKAAFRTLAGTLERERNIRNLSSLGDPDRLYRNAYDGNVSYDPITNTFLLTINESHPFENTTPLIEEIDFEWLRGQGHAAQRAKSILRHHNGVGLTLNTAYPNKINRRWEARDLSVEIQGDLVSTLQLGDAVRVTYTYPKENEFKQVIDDVFIVKTIQSRELSGQKVATLTLSSLFTAGGYDPLFDYNNRVYLYGTAVKYQSTPGPSAERHHWA
jgi:hypothetical protein